MRDNVLVFTEDHVSPNLAELGSYFARLPAARRPRLPDPPASRVGRVVRPGAAHATRELRARSPACSASTGRGSARLHLNRPGYLTFLASRPRYDPRAAASAGQVQVWESLLVKLKEFELFHALRRAMVLVRAQRRRPARPRARLRPAPAPVVEARRLSASTRPLDFMAPWVIDPLVARFGLIYDISDFTETVTMLRRSGRARAGPLLPHDVPLPAQGQPLASQNRAKLEKYLGDGAFYSSREARPHAGAGDADPARLPRGAAKGFPFSKGLRIALNHGQYRLLPIQIGSQAESERYEFFGHGVVELTRLTTGKGTREIEEIKNAADHPRLPRGDRQPLLRADDAAERRRRRQAARRRAGSTPTSTRTASLVNEGIVATWRLRLAARRGGRFRARLPAARRASAPRSR